MVGFIGKYFWKIKICAILLVVIFLLPYAFFLYFITLGMSGFDLLHVLSRYQFYLCFLWACLAFYYISGAERNDVREASGALWKSKFVYENTAFFWILVKVITWNLGMAVILCAGSLVNDGTGYFLTWFWKSYFYNVLLPQLICVLIAYTINLMKNQMRWFGFLLFFLFMISPFTENIVWRTQPSVPVDRIWKGIRWPFSILYQNGEWSPDLQYGLQTESVRLYLFIFWILLMLCLISSQRFRRKSIGILFGAFAAVSLFCSFLPASLYRLNSSWDGVNQDRVIYAGNKVSEEEDRDKVTFYQLELSLKRELEVMCQMEIQSEDLQEVHAFTLYRGYHVSKVQSLAEDVQVKFSQTDDELLLIADRKVDRLSVRIEYKGHHPKFYSNAEAAMLPGWFPWYPMAGKRQIYVSERNVQGYNPYNRIAKSKCRLKVKQHVLSNLEKLEEGVYEGEADSITVLYGNLIETEQPDIVKDYLPFGLYKDTPAERYSSELKKEYEHELDLLENQCGVDVSAFRGKMLLFASKDLGRNNMNNQLAVFDDYILTAPGYLTADQLLQYLALKDNLNREVQKSSSIIQNCLLYLMIRDTSEETIGDFREMLQWSADVDEESDESQQLMNLLDMFIEQGKTDELARALTGYMLHPDAYENDNAFIQEMVELL